MASAERLFFAGLGEALEPVLADRLEHQEALVGDRLEHVEVDERRELAQLRVANREPRRPCDVGEQKADGAAREVFSHSELIFNGSRPGVQPVCGPSVDPARGSGFARRPAALRPAQHVRIGATLYGLPWGASADRVHMHYGAEEMFFVLSGLFAFFTAFYFGRTNAEASCPTYHRRTSGTVEVRSRRHPHNHNRRIGSRGAGRLDAASRPPARALIRQIA